MRLSPEAKAGLLLAAAALLGIVAENAPALRPHYDQFLALRLTVAAGEAAIEKPLLLWINDGLMAIFFLLVALEIKREVYEGALSTWKRAALPVYGAIGGMVAPALVFVGIVGLDSLEAKGWAIPAATDIAFALGVLGLFGDRIPAELKTFLLALAVVDDLGAILIIAVFYTADLGVTALVLGCLAGAGLAALNVAGARRYTPYVLVGLVLWVCVLKSGVHATLAGAAVGFAIPFRKDLAGHSPSLAAEHGLLGWVAYLVMPLFAFANAGVALDGFGPAQLAAPLPLAILLGLFVGKQVGVFGCALAAIGLGLAERPREASLVEVYGVSLLAGIGFTMSLFIGTLAFADPGYQAQVRIGVLAGSLLSGLAGAAVLYIGGRRRRRGYGQNG